MRLRIRVAVLLVGLACCSFAKMVAQAPGVLHVSRSSMERGEHGSIFFRIWGTIEGEKVELLHYSPVGQRGEKVAGPIAPGDYPVKVVSDKAGMGIERRYDVEVTPGKHVSMDLVGLAE